MIAHSILLPSHQHARQSFCLFITRGCARCKVQHIASRCNTLQLIATRIHDRWARARRKVQLIARDRFMTGGCSHCRVQASRRECKRPDLNHTTHKTSITPCYVTPHINEQQNISIAKNILEHTTHTHTNTYT